MARSLVREWNPTRPHPRARPRGAAEVHILSRGSDWCRRWDSNPHALSGHPILSRARLPVPPHRHGVVSRDSIRLRGQGGPHRAGAVDFFSRTDAGVAMKATSERRRHVERSIAATAADGRDAGTSGPPSGRRNAVPRAHPSAAPEPAVRAAHARHAGAGRPADGVRSDPARVRAGADRVPRVRPARGAATRGHPAVPGDGRRRRRPRLVGAAGGHADLRARRGAALLGAAQDAAVAARRVLRCPRGPRTRRAGRRRLPGGHDRRRPHGRRRRLVRGAGPDSDHGAAITPGSDPRGARGRRR